MTDWTLKIIALLHDPPGKILGLAGHQRRAFELIEQVLGPDEFCHRLGKPAKELSRRDFEGTQEVQLIKEADRLASAIDRAAFPKQVRLESEDFVQNLQVRHPFCGRHLSLDCNGSEVEYSQDILDFVSAQLDSRKKYLALWRLLPLLSPGPTTRLLPPDTRILDHTLWTHLDTSAGLVSALPEVAMLQVAIGPVQTFIYEARRTQDLWVGSYLLAFLAWSGIKVIAETYGPDAVLYPSLRGHPWVDRWLKKELGPLPSSVFTGDITIATTPNKFVALLPAKDVQSIAEKIINAIREKWGEIAEAVQQNFPSGPREGTWQTIWERQVRRKDWPEVYWSAVLWPGTKSYPQGEGAEEALRRVEACLGSQPSRQHRLDLYRQSWKQGINVGSMYDALHELLIAALDARKHSRDFLPDEEDGEKCTVSSSLSALRTAEKQTRNEVRQYWQQVARQLKHEGRAHELVADGRERLSAIAAIKRFAQQSYFAPQHRIRLYFPSTSRVAAAPFYRELITQLSGNEKLQWALRGLLESLENLGYPTVSAESAKGALPGLQRDVAQLSGVIRGEAEKLLVYEADVLYPERLEPRLLEREYGLSDRDTALRVQETSRALRREVGMNPSAYYAVLIIDGDDMGRWLSGKHGKMPSLREVMHPNVLPKFSSLPNASDWNRILAAPRTLAANLHASLSAALSTFAWRCVRWVVEQRHYGRVVYAGGDDVLALLPLADGVSAAYELYALFTGYAEVQNGDLRIKTESNGFLKWEDEFLLVPGPHITPSAGLAVVHHLYPLDAALAVARAAERTAKQVADKAAVAVQVMKRSGETVTLRSKWDSLSGRFDALVGHFREKRLSSRFAYDLSSRAHIVTALPADAREATIKQLVERHKTDRLTNPATLVDELTAWAQDLDSQTPPETVDGVSVPQGLAELARWVVFARFVAQGGGE
ncbi:MAG: type III-B CRISPR-associated protein Cas10/Cmr2 [bacterium]